MSAVIKPIDTPFIEWCQYVTSSDEFVILDTETTGFYGEVIDLAIVSYRGKELYNSLLRPLCAIEDDAKATHHINEQMLENAPTIKDEWEKIASILAGKKIVTYNAKFDSERIQETAWAHRCFSKRLLAPMWTYQCAMIGYADFYKEPSRKGYRSFQWQPLNQACYQQGIMLPPGLHRAMPDTRATFALLCKIAATGANSPTYKDFERLKAVEHQGESAL